MCGIAGVIHRDVAGNVGQEMTAMLQSLRHRGPDSTGYAVYGAPEPNEYVMRLKVAEQEDMSRGFSIHEEVKQRRHKIEERLASLGVQILDQKNATEYASRYRVHYRGDMKTLVDYVEDVDGVEILSMGNALELIKDLGDASHVADQYGLQQFTGTHGIGHTRMATESDVDIRSAHPYWAYPYNDIAVVHNGQLTNYWAMRRDFERRGHRFVSDCDSELLAVYTAYNLEQGATLEDSLKQSIEQIDGVFTYLVSTKDALGMAKDTMAAKPMVLFESESLVALASEEVAIRAVIDREIETRDPYDEEVLVWRV
jgi:glutamate synthase domain-containing protein 1